jgi:hypothetical protein
MFALKILVESLVLLVCKNKVMVVLIVYEFYGAGFEIVDSML